MEAGRGHSHLDEVFLAIVWRVDERGPKRNVRRMLLRGLVMIAG